MSETKCQECEALNGAHHPRCTLIDFKSAREELLRYYEKWLKAENIRRETVERYRKQVVFWQGKHTMLRHENNALRRKAVAVKDNPRQPYPSGLREIP